jgi:hypothetical protein
MLSLIKLCEPVAEPVAIKEDTQINIGKNYKKPFDISGNPVIEVKDDFTRECLTAANLLTERFPVSQRLRA